MFEFSELLLDNVFHIRPLILIHLISAQILVMLSAQAALFFQNGQEVIVKSGIDACHRKELGVLASVDRIERSASVKPVLALLVVP
jgi:hypothetical protein